MHGPDGRSALPVDAVLDLREAVETARATGARRRHVLEPSMAAARERARRISAQALIGDAGAVEGHRAAELRSLAYHRALAGRLTRPMVDEARRLVWKWRDQGHLDARYADAWEEVLARPVADVKRFISEDSDLARQLRQASPFAGMLSEPERRRILEEVR